MQSHCANRSENSGTKKKKNKEVLYEEKLERKEHCIIMGWIALGALRFDDSRSPQSRDCSVMSGATKRALEHEGEKKKGAALFLYMKCRREVRIRLFLAMNAH